jgi:hypothetical protein
METRNDSDLLPLLLTGVAVLIMGTAVAMYSNDAGQPNGPSQNGPAATSTPAPAAATAPQSDSPPPQ